MVDGGRSELAVRTDSYTAAVGPYAKNGGRKKQATVPSRSTLEEDSSQKAPPPMLAESLGFNPIRYIQYAFYTWLTPLLQKGYKNQLHPEDMVGLIPRMRSKQLGERLENSYIMYKRRNVQRPLFRAILSSHFTQLAAAGLLLMMEFICALFQSVLLGWLLAAMAEAAGGTAVDVNNTNNSTDNMMLDAAPNISSNMSATTIPTTTRRDVYGYAAALSATTFLRVFFLHVGALQQWFTGMEIRAASIAIIYRKLLQLRAENIAELPSGQLISVISADVERFTMFWFGHSIWLAPLLICAVVGIGHMQIGWSILAGVGVNTVLLPLQLVCGRYFGRLRRKTAACTDKRVSTMKDILHGIRGVKAAAWEEPFSRTVEKLRADETKHLMHTAYIKSINISFFFGMTALCTFASLMTFTSTGGVLTPTKLFTVFSLFGSIRLVAGMMLPACIQTLNELFVTVQRMERILDLKSAPQPPENSTVAEGGFAGGAEGSGKIASATSAYGGGGVVTATHSADATALALRTDLRLSTAVAKPSRSTLASSASASRSTPAALTVRNLKCSWETPEGIKVPVLQGDGVDFQLGFGELAVVLGPVGAGKSTLLMALLRELTPDSGQIEHGDTPMLYAPQQPWVFPGTVRENILWGRSLDPVWYQKTVEACQLVADLLQMDSGDGAMIGERGITLSGGQKARVSLARTVYAAGTVGRKCILLLDDPFSAVDARVGNLLYTQVIEELLADHACLVVTHHTQLAKDADVVLVLDNNGNQRDAAAAKAILESAAQSSSNSAGGGVGDGDNGTGNRNGSAEGGDAVAVVNPNPIVWQSGKTSKAVITEENRVAGNVTFQTVWAYFSAAGSNVLIGTTVVLLVGVQISDVIINLYLADWSQLTEAEQSTQQTIRTRNYGYLMAGFVVLLLIRSLVYVHLAVLASKALHHKAFEGVMRVALRFFDTQPVGRILNRFTKDVGYIDDLLPDTGIDVFQLGLLCLAVVLTICALDPYVLLMASPCIAAFFVIRWYYLKTSQEVKRVEGIERSPLYAHVSTSLEGLPLLRAFPGALERNLRQFQDLQDNHTRAWLTFILTSRWLGARLDLIVFLLVVVTAFSAVAQLDKLDAGSTGLSLSYIMQLTGVFQWAVRQSAEMQNQLTSVERLEEYAALEKEEETVNHDSSSSSNGAGGSSGNDAHDAENWQATEGAIEFVNLSLFYDATATSASDATLKKLNLKIAAGAKVGVVGRTGAGKSSLIIALLRLALTTGEVLIDGRATWTLPLKKLRKLMSLIPQDPVLFSGTVRKNLDPFNQSDEQSLWCAIESAQLKPCIVQLGGLDAEVQEFGSNFSVGERQLICLARAILRPTSILILDEATANVDKTTDAVIQAVIREKFADCTVITIAHRLDTVIDSDMIVVMDNGRVVESGPPLTLLANDGGEFSKLYAASKQASTNGEDGSTD